ncbi:hypothetical protein [Staphylococcus nepalensis]|nr:hypothetical protein [Staphylococcus nepalensis]MDR5650802.1 hypothetical protein [Staphylococcus nepalensis]
MRDGDEVQEVEEVQVVVEVEDEDEDRASEDVLAEEDINAINFDSVLDV